ncbi:clan AA aspartic protease [Bermanella marisrubri]|uniref:TIGR02281 family clan AA aspartic protease n=1 Tax=Bermanella marisrubri TaxID=207949 RepID=Q1MZG1_9GAMM|nr:retropepsin-like aspartic protease [Bermanella marisrubri]EAT11305.1 hypothetical protein RED65_12797 [Oceanobacter sp. RED65] [Bermanella marisrubri]QIZ85307.1 clan AA aspartic protease [Bermanella marisrubri]
MKSFTFIILSFSLLYTSQLWAQVTAVGLMPGMAILEHEGSRLILKQGQTKQGIHLLEAGSDFAIIEINGREIELELGASVADGYAEPSGAQVRITRSDNGQYFTPANINGRSINMLVDTGATHVAMSEEHAQQLGIDYSKGTRGRASTAGGIVNSYKVQLNKMQVGGITRYNVDATIIQGSFPAIPLLGMSFLNQLSMREEQGILMLSD